MSPPRPSDNLVQYREVCSMVHGGRKAARTFVGVSVGLVLRLTALPALSGRFRSPAVHLDSPAGSAISAINRRSLGSNGHTRHNAKLSLAFGAKRTSLGLLWFDPVAIDPQWSSTCKILLYRTIQSSLWNVPICTMPSPNSRSAAASRRVLSFAGKCEYRFLDLCFGEIFDPFQVNLREIGQFVG